MVYLVYAVSVLFYALDGEGVGGILSFTPLVKGIKLTSFCRRAAVFIGYLMQG